MPATTRGTTGLLFAFASAETGGLLQNLLIRNAVKEKTVPNESGETVGVSLYDRSEEWSFDWYTTGTAGLGAIDPGELIALSTTAPGINNEAVATGVLNATEVTTERKNEDYTKKSCTAKVWPLITS